MKKADIHNSTDQSRSHCGTRWLRRYGVTLLLVGVATHQFYRVHAEGLSSWRGGGFGMYGGYHPVDNDLWWIDHETGEAIRYTKKKGIATEDHRYRGLRPFLTYVNEDALKRYHENLIPQLQATTLLSVWQPDFDPETNILTRRQLISAGLVLPQPEAESELVPVPSNHSTGGQP